MPTPEIDFEVLKAFCRGYPDSNGFVERLRHNPKALFLSHWENHFEWKFAAATFPPGSLILDWGCGTGHSDIFLARNGYTVVGFDIDRLGITIASYLRSLESAEVMNRLLFSLRAPISPYSFAWSSHVLEHVPRNEWQKFFENIADAGASRALLSVPLGRAYFDPDHKNFWNDETAFAADLRASGNITVDWTRVDVEHEVIRAMVSIRPPRSFSGE